MPTCGELFSIAVLCVRRKFARTCRGCALLPHYPHVPALSVLRTTYKNLARSELLTLSQIVYSNSTISLVIANLSLSGTSRHRG